MKFRFFIFIIVAVIFGGCAVKNSNSLPSWYINPVENTAIFIYGVGEGGSLNEAKNSALNDMASRLNVSVNSSVNQFKQTIENTNKQDSFEKKISTNLNVEVKDIEFPNAQILNSEVVNSRYYVLAKVDKNELIKSYTTKLKLNDNLIRKSLKNALLDDKDKTFELLKLVPLVNKAISQTTLLSSLDSSFNGNSYISEFSGIKNQLDTLKASLSIEVDSNYRLKYFANIVTTLLKNDGYRVVQSGGELKVVLNSTFDTTRDMAWQDVEVKTTISTLSNGRTVSNTEVTSSGKSSKSKDDAILKASYIFKEKVESKGIEEFIFQ